MNDTENPTISCNAPIVKNNDAGQCGAIVTYTVTSTDNCPGQTVAQTAGIASGGFFPKGTTTNTFVVTDASGNTATCSFTVTVNDTEAPGITCPADVTVNCQDDNSSASTGTATANDNCTDIESIIITQSQTSTQTATGAGHYNYVISRTWRATDVTGNFSECVQTITVRDVTAPVITCPANVTLNCQDNNTSASTGVASATDNCSAVTITQSQTSTQTPSGSGHYNYVITRKWKAMDETGNYSTCVQTITVHDVTAPVITCPTNKTVNCQDDNSSASTGVASATDNCSAVTITQSQTSTQTPSGSGHYNYVITRTWRATDESGNFSECVQTIIVHDVTAPVITCPANVTLNCQDNNTPTSTGVATATDNCSTTSISHYDLTTQNPNVNSPAHYNYTISRIWRATDVSGNYSECTQTITVHDITAPDAICKPVTITLVGGTATIIPSNVDNGSSDICSPVTLSLSKTSFNCTNLGNNTVTLTVTDVSGNSSTCTAVVTVLGTMPTCSITAVPSSTVYTGGVATNLYLGYGPNMDTLKVAVPASGAPYTYSWSGGTLSNYNTANPVFTATTPGSFTFTVLVTNNYGCTTTCTISICVTDIRVAGTNGNNQKVYLCHNQGNPNTLSISTNAVNAHLRDHANDRLGTCELLPCTVPTSFARITIEETVKPQAVALLVRAYPNPSSNYFMVSIDSKDDTPVTVRVMNNIGQFIDVERTIKPGSIIQLGEGYIGGSYYLQAIQGKEHVTVKLVKLN